MDPGEGSRKGREEVDPKVLNTNLYNFTIIPRDSSEMTLVKIYENVGPSEATSSCLSSAKPPTATWQKFVGESSC